MNGLLNRQICCHFSWLLNTCKCTLTLRTESIPETLSPWHSSSPVPPIETTSSRDHHPGRFKLPLGFQQYCCNRPSPVSRNEPFSLHVDSLEDQLAVDANTASPLNFDDSDKENDVTNPNLEPDPDAHRGISVMPLSLYGRSTESYRATGETLMAREALYCRDRSMSSPYGLGEYATLDEIYHLDPGFDEYGRILASSEHLLREGS